MGLACNTNSGSDYQKRQDTWEMKTILEDDSMGFDCATNSSSDSKNRKDTLEKLMKKIVSKDINSSKYLECKNYFISFIF